ncbi:universal stress protein [Variovorax defluvii]|uniref:Universal stress protein n=1 Tax=Variovorax defluvii TaxID=913761 RepID=A0ABP8IDF3_9BURK
MYERILVPIDGSATSMRGLDEAVRLARLTGGAIRLIHVVDELKYVTGFESFAAYSGDIVPLMAQAGKEVLAQGRERVRRAGMEAESVLFTSLAGRVSELVVEQAKAWQADLIVIGTHGRHGVARALLGSDAEQVLRMAPVPVLLVRAKSDTRDDEGAQAPVPDAVKLQA